MCRPAQCRIVIRVAFKTARFGSFRAGFVAGAAGGDAGQQHVGALLAGERGGVAARAIHKAVLGVIEIPVRHISRRDAGTRDFRQSSAFTESERVALLAGLAPEKLLGLGSALNHPLLRRFQTIVRGNQLFRQVAAGIARHAQFGGMRRDVRLQLGDDERMNYFRGVVWHRLR